MPEGWKVEVSNNLQASKSIHLGPPPSLVIIFAITGATFGFDWCLAKLAGFFITAQKTKIKKRRNWN